MIEGVLLIGSQQRSHGESGHCLESLLFGRKIFSAELSLRNLQ